MLTAAFLEKSVYDGMGMPHEHIDFVIENGMDAMALTEHGHMNSYTHALFHTQKLNADGVKFKYIPGCEFYVHPDLKEWARQKTEREEKKKEEKKAKRAKKERDDQGLTVEDEDASKRERFYDPIKRRHHLVVLAKNTKGLRALFKLISSGYRDGFYRFPRVDYAQLKEYKGDLVASTACIAGPLSYEIFEAFPGVPFEGLGPHLLDDEEVFEGILKKAQLTLDALIDTFGRENLFLELQFNKFAAQHLTNRVLIELSRRNGVALTVTSDSHYPRPENWKDRELYKKLGWLNYEDYDPSKLPQSIDDLKCELYPKNASQVWETYLSTTTDFDFYDDVEVRDAIERTHWIAHELLGDPEYDTSMKLPSYVIPKGKTEFRALVDLCKDGMQKLGLDDSESHLERLKKELKIVKDKGFSRYFLTMRAIISVAEKNMLIGPGRGSSAGSLICYCLGITSIDPLKYDLIFERFCAPWRSDEPDVDSDFSDRDGLIDLLKEEFGDENVVPISNYNTFKLNSLIRDISRFYGIPHIEVNAVMKQADKETRRAVLVRGVDKNTYDMTYEQAYEHSKVFREFIDKHPQVSEHVNALLMQNRSVGRHAGGVIISENIDEFMPLIRVRGEMQTPWVEGIAAKHLGRMGNIKFDILGLETLKMVERTIELILTREAKARGEDDFEPTFDDVKSWFEKHLHPSKIDLNDQHVYQHVYHEGRFAGVFQLTSRGAQNLFKKAKPCNIVDIAALTSIYRPGPLDANVDKLYVKAKENPETIKYDHPILKEITEETFGFVIFQEQLLKIANKLAGFNMEECDKLRKLLMKKSKEKEAYREKATAETKKKFVAGCVKNGLDSMKAGQLFDNLASFSGYAFNLSHAVSYAIDSYWCAWLLTYYEAEWMCAYLESMSGDPKKRAHAMAELKSHGYEIVPIDVNHATKNWTILPGKKFMPSLLSIKGVGVAAIDEIVKYRPYNNIYDLLWNEDGTWKHSKFNKRSIDALIKIGAFGSMNMIGPEKTFESYAHMHRVVVENMNKIRHKKKGRDSFEELLIELSGGDDWSRGEKIAFYKELIGDINLDLIISPRVRDRLAEHGIRSLDEHNGKGVYWFVLDNAVQKTTRNGKPYLLLNVVTPLGAKQKVYCWGWNPENHSMLRGNTAFMAEISPFGDGDGMSTTIYKLREMSEKK